MKLKLTVLMMTLALNGCTTNPFTAPENVLNDIKQQKQHTLTARDDAPSFDNVFLYNGMYVEQLSLAESVLPNWYHKKCSTSFGEMKLSKLLTKLFDGKRVNIEYRDGVEKDSHIKVSGDDLTHGDILEAIAAETGYTFKADEATVVLSKYQTRVFPVRVLGGSVQYSIGKKKLAQASSGSSGQDEVKSDLVANVGDEFSVISGQVDPLADFKTGVDEVLGCTVQAKQTRQDKQPADFAITSAPNAPQQSKHSEQSTCAQGASAKLVPSNNSIIVRAIPSQLEQVAKYIERQHQVAMRQIRVNLTLVSVEMAKDSQLNLDFDVSDSHLFGSSLGVKHVTSAFTNMLGGLGNRGKTVLQHKNGSSLAIEALSKQGSILQSSVLRAVLINHRITQLTNVSKVSYISDRPQQVTVNAGTTRGIEQKVAQSGTLLYMLPNIGVKDAVLHISSSQSALIRLDPKGEGDNQVESPVVDDKMLNTSVILQPGRPVFIGGFSNNELNAVFSESGALLPGMSRSSVDKNVETVMVLEMEFI